MRTLSLTFALLLCLFAGCKARSAEQGTQPSANDMTTTTDTSAAKKDALVELNTTDGRVVLRLYGDTPKHRDNFLKLVKEGFYDGLLFHRVIKDFMVQTGDPDSRNAPAGKQLGSGDPGYTIDAEILCPTHFNKRGALAAARTGDNVNPERRSSGSQFYVVTGRKFTPAELDRMDQQLRMQQMQDIFNGLVKQHMDSIMQMRRKGDMAGLQKLQEELAQQTEVIAEARPGMGLGEEQRKAYAEVGGAPHLDGAYTVFGEVVEGMDVVEKIENAPTDAADRPKEDVKIISAKVLQE